MLDQNLKSQLSQYLALLESDITFLASLDTSENSQKLKEFLEDVAGLSDRITIEEGKLELTPSFEILKGKESLGITFAGLPLGHEFESFVLALLQISGRAPKIDEGQAERIKAITEKIHFETVVSLSCHNCPEIVQALNIMSVLNPNISHTMIEGGAHQDIVDARQVMAVPAVFKNGQEFHNGRSSFDALLEKVAGPKSSDELDGIEDFDVLVIGGGPAAGAAAIYAARKGIRTGIICDEFGGQVNETQGIENIIGTPYVEGPKFMDQVKAHVNEYNVDLFEGYTAEAIERDDKVLVTLNTGHQLKSKTAIIATGARWRLLGIPGESELKNKGVAYCPHCDGPLFKDKKVAVIGGGNSGVEAALDLAGLAEEIIVIEYTADLCADDVLQKRLRSLKNVKIITSANTTEIEGDSKVTGLTYIDRDSGQSHHLDVDGVFILVGLVPNTEWVEGLEKTRIGEIVIGPDGATSMEGVYAAGDCSNQLYKQIIISMGSGATAALGAYNHIVING